jgi:hypothetical protein
MMLFLSIVVSAGEQDDQRGVALQLAEPAGRQLWSGSS